MNAYRTTLLDIVLENETSDEPTLRQYAKSLVKILEFSGFDRTDIAAMPVDLGAYLEIAPKFNKRLGWLVEAITRKGWSNATYKQYQSDGRRLIETVTGALADRQERRSRDDGFAELQRRTTLLAEVNMIEAVRLRSLAAIANAARAVGHDVSDLDRERVLALRSNCLMERDWSLVKRGAALLDDLRPFASLSDVLPVEEIGNLAGGLRELRKIPEGIASEIDTWVDAATQRKPQNLVSDEARKMYTTQLSDGARGIFRAALRAYVHTLGKLGECPEGSTLADLFSDAAIERVIVDWTQNSKSSKGLTARTISSYAVRIRLTLEAVGQPKGASKVHELCRAVPTIKEGRAAGEVMSPATVQWCSDLLASDKHLRLFEMQHVHYAKKANDALTEAAAAGFDLVELSDPYAMQKLPAAARAQAKRLLRRAQMFGVCAAFAAIELEAAPLRRATTLGLQMSGQGQTFFNHSRDPDPYFEIIIPNELLKNGKALTMRQQSLPPFKMVKGRRGDGTYAFQILEFFLKRIRPLFPGAKRSRALFAPLKETHDALLDSTFHDWLRECSVEIGFPLTAHNFRHGLCSIEINSDPSCIEQLANLMGDKPGTIRRYYAFIDRAEQNRRMQRNRAERRKAFHSAEDWKAV